MAAKIKPSDLACLTEYLPDPDVRLRNVDYKNESSSIDPNAPYHLAIEVLCKGLQKHFPQRTDNTILQTIKQRPEKATEDFLHCLEGAFNKYSGLAQPPHPLTNPAEAWERLLCSYILDGLCLRLQLKPKLHMWVGGLA